MRASTWLILCVLLTGVNANGTSPPIRGAVSRSHLKPSMARDVRTRLRANVGELHTTTPKEDTVARPSLPPQADTGLSDRAVAAAETVAAPSENEADSVQNAIATATMEAPPQADESAETETEDGSEPDPEPATQQVTGERTASARDNEAAPEVEQPQDASPDASAEAPRVYVYDVGYSHGDTMVEDNGLNFQIRFRFKGAALQAGGVGSCPRFVLEQRRIQYVGFTVTWFA
eukprot:1185852-Prorocentrum_minimum.AAC.1